MKRRLILCFGALLVAGSSALIFAAERQEVPAIMKAVVETGHKGFVAQEFIPKRPDAIASLRQGVGICDV